MKKLYVLMAMVIAVTSLNAQISLLKDIRTDSETASGTPQKMASFNGKVYFYANDGNGNELWVTDGTANGTSMIDFDAASNATVDNFIVYDNELHFFLKEGAFPYVKSISKINTAGDGVETVLETSDDLLKQAVVLGNNIYFQQQDDQYINHLYVFDGTDVNPIEVSDEAQRDMHFESAITFGDNLLVYTGRSDEYWDAPSLTGYGKELYLYNITAKTLTLVKDLVESYFIQPGFWGSADTPYPNSAGITDFTSLGEEVFFIANEPTAEIIPGQYNGPVVRQVLYVTNGTTEGTMKVEMIDADDNAIDMSSVSNLFNWNGKLYFSGNDNSDNGNELWVYDPTTEMAQMLSSIDGTANHSPEGFCEYDSELYYIGREADNYTYLFKTDGTSSSRVDPNTNVNSIDDLAVTGNSLVFKGKGETGGSELYSYTPMPTTIGEMPDAKTYSVYPNPTVGVVNIKGLESNNANYKVYNLAGSVVEQGVVANNQIALRVIKGVYMLEISEGGNTAIQKVVVK